MWSIVTACLWTTKAPLIAQLLKKGKMSFYAIIYQIPDFKKLSKAVNGLNETYCIMMIYNRVPEKNNNSNFVIFSWIHAMTDNFWT